jgi:hypothetical protein
MRERFQFQEADRDVAKALPEALGQVLAPKSFFSRFFGILGCEEQLATRSLVFRNCRALHTFGLSDEIAVIATNREWELIAVLLVPPGRIVHASGQCSHLIETHKEKIPALYKMMGSSNNETRHVDD